MVAEKKTPNSFTLEFFHRKISHLASVDLSSLQPTDATLKIECQGLYSTYLVNSKLSLGLVLTKSFPC